MVDTLQLEKDLRNIVNQFGYGVTINAKEETDKQGIYGDYKYSMVIWKNGRLYYRHEYYFVRYFLFGSYTMNSIIEYTVEPKWRKEYKKNSPLDVYVRGLIDYRNYVIKYHTEGIWDDVYERAKSVTDDKLVALKLFAGEIKTEYDAWKKSNEFGLPRLVNKTTTLNRVDLNQSHRKYAEYAMDKIKNKEDFSCRWVARAISPYAIREIIVVGKKGETYRTWLVIKNGNYLDGIYSLLDGNHAVIAEDCNMLDFSQLERAERCDEE
jgi:hypothetical protein